MSIKHAPSPWIIDTHKVSNSNGQKDYVIIRILDAEGRLVTEMTDLSRTEQNMANAKVIAEAPKALDVLIGLVDAIFHWQKSGKPDLGVFSRLKDAAAIAINRSINLMSCPECGSRIRTAGCHWCDHAVANAKED